MCDDLPNPNKLCLVHPRSQSPVRPSCPICLTKLATTSNPRYGYPPAEQGGVTVGDTLTTQGHIAKITRHSAVSTSDVIVDRTQARRTGRHHGKCRRQHYCSRKHKPGSLEVPFPGGSTGDSWYSKLGVDVEIVIWLGEEHFHKYETHHLSLAHSLRLRGTDTVQHYRPYGSTYPHILEPLADISCHRGLLGQWWGKEIEVIIKRRSGGVIHWKFKHEFLIWYYQIIINFPPPLLLQTVW